MDLTYVLKLLSSK